MIQPATLNLANRTASCRQRHHPPPSHGVNSHDHPPHCPALLVLTGTCAVNILFTRTLPLLQPSFLLIQSTCRSCPARLYTVLTLVVLLALTVFLSTGCPCSSVILDFLFYLPWPSFLLVCCTCQSCSLYSSHPSHLLTNLAPEGLIFLQY